MGFIARLFMDSHQRALTNSKDYDRALDPGQIRAEIKGGEGHYGSEMKGYLLDAVETASKDGPLTIRAAVRDFYAMDDALKRPHDNSLHEFGVTARLGSKVLADFLISRANKLAEGIKPGAQSAMSQAFGGVDG